LVSLSGSTPALLSTDPDANYAELDGTGAENIVRVGSELLVEDYTVLSVADYSIRKGETYFIAPNRAGWVMMVLMPADLSAELS